MVLTDDVVDELLGPPAAPRGLSGLRPALENKTVLVTGAGGSIGSELSLAIARIGCRRLILLDNCDHDLIEVCDRVRETRPGQAFGEALCDVRDRQRMRIVFERERPDLVIHAAAQKHVHLGDRHPGECVLTNLAGVRNAIDSLEAAGGGRFVLVSTDKAASPVSVMGACKRLSEMYVRGVHAGCGPVEAMAVRFGNVFGTRGSVAPAFARQIAAGGPILLTHPEMERYFMRLSDAVALILQAASARSVDVRAAPSPILLLEMGQPLKILDLARRMAALAARRSGAPETPIKIIGLREGEKLSEALFDDHETLLPSGIEGVWRVQPLSQSAVIGPDIVADLEAIARSANDGLIRQRVFGALDAAVGRLCEAAG